MKLLRPLVPAALVSAAALNLPACGQKGASFTPTATIEKTEVKVMVTCSDIALITIGEERETCLGDDPVEFHIPLASLGAGKHVIKVSGLGDDPQPTVVEVPIEIPADAIGPMFAVKRCGTHTSVADHKFVDLKVGDTIVSDCMTYDGARAKLEIEANPKGTVIIGGKRTEVGEDGKLSLVVPFDEALLAMTIDQLFDESTDAPPTIAVPYEYEPPAGVKGDKISGKLAFTALFGSHDEIVARWLRDIAEKKIDRPAFTPAPAGDRLTIVRVPASPFAGATVTDRRGTGRDIDMVALERVTSSKESGTCEYETNDKKVVSAKRINEEVEVVVTKLADGSEAARKTFAPAPDECPMFAMLDDTNPTATNTVGEKPVMEWLETLALP